MAHRRLTVLMAGVSAFALMPAFAYAGAGGAPPAPGASAAGTSTTYCCTTWTAVESGDKKNPITTFSGTGCTPIDEAPAANRDACFAGNQALKCRGEFYTTGDNVGAGSVRRCFSP
jgi:hypothetical protein